MDPNNEPYPENEFAAMPRYANLMQVTHSKEEFVLEFYYMSDPDSQLLSRLVVSPDHAKRIIRALQENVAKHRSRFGKAAVSDHSRPDAAHDGTENARLRKHARLLERKNVAYEMLLSSERMLQKAGDGVSEMDRRAVETAIAALREAKDGEDVKAIEDATKELSAAAERIGQRIHGDQGESTSA